MKMKRLIIILTLMLCLTTGFSYFIGLYMSNSIANKLYISSVDKDSNYFNAKDINFLNKKKHSFTFIAREYLNVSSGMVEEQIEIIGTNENFPYMKKLELLSGSFFNEIHMEKNSNVVVLTSEAAWRFFGNKESVGNEVIIANEKFKVIGVFEKGLAQEDEILLYMPFSKLNQLASNELKILNIWLQLDNIGEVEPIIVEMGYSFENINLVDINQYKNIVMQRFKFIVFMIGLSIMIFLLKILLNNIRILKQKIIEFLKENYLKNIWLVFSNKKTIFQLLYSLAYLLSAILIWKVIRFKPNIPKEFFMWSDYNFYILRDILDFYVQPNIGVPVLEYLNQINTISNILFFLSISLFTLILTILFVLSKKNQENNKLENKNDESFI